MRILIAPDKYKGTLTAHEAAHAIAHGVRTACAERGITPELDFCPLSDGGEGFLDIMAQATGARIEHLTAINALGEPTRVPVGFVGAGHTQAIVESAHIIGLQLVPDDKRNPEQLTTVGVGTLLIELARKGCNNVTVGLGGSATIDGGIGMASALGYRFLDADDNQLPAIGASLTRIARIVRPKTNPLEGMSIIAACDVDNPLVGEHGAARIYGPQKGATRERVEHLEAGLANLVEKSTLDDTLFAGAAGGLAFGLATWIGAKLKPGARHVLDALHIQQRSAHTDLIFTGEGALDTQTFCAKACTALAECAAPTPVITLPGKLAPDIAREKLANFHAVHPCAPFDAPLPADAIEAANRLERAAHDALLSFLDKPPHHLPPESAP